jgi:hypothetical protein
MFLIYESIANFLLEHDIHIFFKQRLIIWLNSNIKNRELNFLFIAHEKLKEEKNSYKSLEGTCIKWNFCLLVKAAENDVGKANALSEAGSGFTMCSGIAR